MSRLRRGERVDHYETVRMHKDGRRIPVSVTVSPLVAADGTIIGASAIARDISERLAASSGGGRPAAEGRPRRERQSIRGTPSQTSWSRHGPE